MTFKNEELRDYIRANNLSISPRTSDFLRDSKDFDEFKHKCEENLVDLHPDTMTKLKAFVSGVQKQDKTAPAKA